MTTREMMRELLAEQQVRRQRLKEEKMADESYESELCKEGSILTEAAGMIYGEKNESYGSYANESKKIAAIFNKFKGEEVLAPEDVPLVMVVMKLCRQMVKPKRDNLVDVCGYAALWEDMRGE